MRVRIPLPNEVFDEEAINKLGKTERGRSIPLTDQASGQSLGTGMITGAGWEANSPSPFLEIEIDSELYPMLASLGEGQLETSIVGLSVQRS